MIRERDDGRETPFQLGAIVGNRRGPDRAGAHPPASADCARDTGAATMTSAEPPTRKASGDSQVCTGKNRGAGRDRDRERVENRVLQCQRVESHADGTYPAQDSPEFLVSSLVW